MKYKIIKLNFKLTLEEITSILNQWLPISSDMHEDDEVILIAKVYMYFIHHNTR